MPEPDGRLNVITDDHLPRVSHYLYLSRAECVSEGRIAVVCPARRRCATTHCTIGPYIFRPSYSPTLMFNDDTTLMAAACYVSIANTCCSSRARLSNSRRPRSTAAEQHANATLIEEYTCTVNTTHGNTVTLCLLISLLQCEAMSAGVWEPFPTGEVKVKNQVLVLSYNTIC